MFLRNRLQSAERHFVPNGFLRRAVEHLEKTGVPLLYQRLPEYPYVLEAWSDGAGFTLNTPMEEWEPPFRTWREYGVHKGLSALDVMDERGMEEEYELDEEIELFVLEQMVES